MVSPPLQNSSNSRRSYCAEGTTNETDRRIGMAGEGRLHWIPARSKFERAGTRMKTLAE
jgi:hypothetical protein